MWPQIALTSCCTHGNQPALSAAGARESPVLLSSLVESASAWRAVKRCTSYVCPPCWRSAELHVASFWGHDSWKGMSREEKTGAVGCMSNLGPPWIHPISLSHSFRDRRAGILRVLGRRTGVGAWWVDNSTLHCIVVLTSTASQIQAVVNQGNLSWSGRGLTLHTLSNRLGMITSCEC